MPSRAIQYAGADFIVPVTKVPSLLAKLDKGSRCRPESLGNEFPSAKSDSLVALSGLSDGNSLPRDSGRQRLPLSSLASKLGTFVTGTMKSAPAYWMARLGISGANASPGFFDDTHVSANLDCNQSRGNRHPVGPRGLRQPLADHKRERLSETEDRWLAGDDFHSATGYTYAPCLEQQMLVGSCQANNPDFHGSPSAGCRAGHIAPSWPLR